MAAAGAGAAAAAVAAVAAVATVAAAAAAAVAAAAGAVDEVGGVPAGATQAMACAGGSRGYPPECASASAWQLMVAWGTGLVSTRVT